MEKRLFIAVVLSVAFLFGWSFFAPRLFPQLANKRAAAERAAAQRKAAEPEAAKSGASSTAATTAQAPAAQPVAATPVESIPAVAASVEQRVVLDRPEYVAVFSNRGAQLVSFRLKQYKENDGALVELIRPRPADRGDYPFAVRSGDRAWEQRANSALYEVKRSSDGASEIIEFSFSDGRTAITKSFAFSGEYPFQFSVTAKNVPAYRVELGPGIRPLTGDKKDTQFVTSGNGVVQPGDSLEVVRREKASDITVFPAGVRLVGIEDNFFIAVLTPVRAGEAIIRTGVDPASSVDGKPRKEIYAGLNAESGVVEGRAFFGPKKADLLERYGLEKLVRFGFFGFIARMLLEALKWIFGFTQNWGWAIVVLTAFIKILLYPLQHKSITSMKKMQKLQPKMNAIKEKYKKAKTDPEQRQKMNAELMKLYQVEGINPMGGCLPILLQLPILWAFYGMLSSAIELRGADWILWITDLSAKDPYYITPILMTVTMFIQQWMTPTTADPAQRRIFMFMPFIFGFIFKDLPSGLVLYWLVQNILSIAQQMIMNKYWKDHPDEVAAK